MMPEDGLDQLRPFDAIYLGAVGYPGVADHVSLWGLLIPIRRGFQQYVNRRPARLLEGITSPLSGRKAGDIDFIIVRENSEGEYSEVGGRLNRDTEFDMAMQETIFTRRALRPHHYLRLRTRSHAQEARNLGHEVQRHCLCHALLGRALCRDFQRSIPTSKRTSTTSTF